MVFVVEKVDDDGTWWRGNSFLGFIDFSGSNLYASGRKDVHRTPPGPDFYFGKELVIFRVRILGIRSCNVSRGRRKSSSRQSSAGRNVRKRKTASA